MTTPVKLCKDCVHSYNRSFIWRCRKFLAIDEPEVNPVTGERGEDGFCKVLRTTFHREDWCGPKGIGFEQKLIKVSL